MTITKLDTGRYRVDVRPQGRDGKRIRKTFPTKSEAQQYERWIVATQHNKDWIERPADRRPLTDLIELWYAHHGRTLKDGVAMALLNKQILCCPASGTADPVDVKSCS